MALSGSGERANRRRSLHTQSRGCDMKITPDNFAAVFEYMVGEPGPADFHDSLVAQHACRCDNCGTWWCDGETLVAGDFSDEDLCIECWEGFSDVWCEGISAREHEAASAAKERLWDRSCRNQPVAKRRKK